MFEDFGTKYQLKHLNKDCDIIENNGFENGFVEIQEHEELNLTPAKKDAVKILLKPVAASSTPPANGDAEPPTAYAASVLLKRKRIEQDKESAYLLNMLRVCPIYVNVSSVGRNCVFLHFVKG